MKPTLVVLAAGLGSRFGGLKQIEAFGPSGETLLDYTLYDVIKVGFGKIVFVIRETMAETFIPRMHSHFGDSIEMVFVNQQMGDLPVGFKKPKERTKPWGTGHAIRAARNEVTTPFCIVNADDFYGRTALEEMLHLLLKMKNNEYNACLIGYRLQNTLSDHGSVSRGICTLDDGNLVNILEVKHIEKRGNQIGGKKEGDWIELLPETLISMNLIGFSSAVFSLIESEFERFLKGHLYDSTVEFYAPDILQALIQQAVKIPVKESDSTWFGVTYPKDKKVVQSSLKQLVEAGKYPRTLWNNEH